MVKVQPRNMRTEFTGGGDLDFLKSQRASVNFHPYVTYLLSDFHEILHTLLLIIRKFRENRHREGRNFILGVSGSDNKQRLFPYTTLTDRFL
jgi:hypothetical protein